jgi:hypothetical protein
MVDLADRAGTSGLDLAFANFGLDRDPVLEIDTETSPDGALQDPIRAGIGQENLTITPLQDGLAMAALAGDGSLPQPQIGAAVRDETGAWQPWDPGEQPASSATNAATARAVRSALPRVNGVFEFSPLVLSGPEGMTNAWYLGILPGEDVVHVAVIVLENSASEQDALIAGRARLETVR